MICTEKDGQGTFSKKRRRKHMMYIYRLRIERMNGK